MPSLNPNGMKYSYAFHEAGHVFVARTVGVPYLDARVEETNGLGGAFQVDFDAFNGTLNLQRGDHNALHGSLCKLIFVLTAGTTVDRDILRASEAHIALRASGDQKILEEIVKPKYIEGLRSTEGAFASIVGHADTEIHRIITQPYAVLLIARIAEVIFTKGIATAANINESLANIST